MQTSLTDHNGSTTGGEVLWQCSLRMRRANSCKGLQINTSVEDSRTATPRRSLSSDNITSIAAEPPTDGEKTTGTTTTTEDWDTSSSTASKALKPKARKKETRQTDHATKEGASWSTSAWDLRGRTSCRLYPWVAWPERHVSLVAPVTLTSPPCPPSSLP